MKCSRNTAAEPNPDRRATSSTGRSALSSSRSASRTRWESSQAYGVVPVCARKCRAKLREDRPTRFVAAEPAACPTLTRGVYRYDFGDTVGLTPLVAMHTLGHDFVPAPIHAGGLRYHGVAPLISQLVLDGLMRAEAYTQNAVFAAGLRFVATGVAAPVAMAQTGHSVPATPAAASARVAFSPDSTRLLSGGGDEMVRLWDLGANKEIVALKGHRGEELVHEGAAVAPGALLIGGTVVGRGAEIGPGVRLDGAVIFDGARIEAGSVIERSIIGFGARIGPRALIRDGVITLEAAMGASTSPHDLTVELRRLGLVA